jgi:4-carboxymuconolactone decarboxylase
MTTSPVLGDAERCSQALVSGPSGRTAAVRIGSPPVEGKTPMADQDARPIMDVLTSMTLASAETTDLDPAVQILVRFAALVALDAAPASYLFHFGAGADQGLTAEDARQVLVTLAPVVGTARIVSASSKIARALGFALEMAELAAEEDAEST